MKTNHSPVCLETKWFHGIVSDIDPDESHKSQQAGGQNQPDQHCVGVLLNSQFNGRERI